MQKVSQFHERLSHLVKYSSQLVFVSGDTVADQHKALSDFMAHQQEDTEISFFKAHPKGIIQDYRSSIAKQLIGAEDFDYSKPLKSLLSNEYILDPSQGPYLICITQSECIENSFIEELWDWIVTMRLANVNLHINIILFGHPLWAKKTYNILPSNDVVTPIILSSKEIDPVGFDVNALESLMADKRSWLSMNNQPVVANKWFLASISIIFIAVFISLMSSIYIDDSADLTDSHSVLEDSQSEVSNVNVLTQEQIQVSNHSLTIFAKNNLQSNIFNVSKRGAEKDKTQSEPNSFTFLAAQSSPYQYIDKTTLTLNNKTNLFKERKNSIANLNGLQIKDVKVVNNNSEQLILTDSKAVLAKTLVDFAVPDITSVEQLTNELSNTRPPVSPFNSQNIDYSKQTNVDYQFDETKLLSMPTDTVVLQLSGIQNPVVLENYLETNNLKSSTWVYETKRYGGPWYVIVYNQAFDSIDAALSNLSILPTDIRESQPFAKSINQIQREISQR